MKRLIKGQLVIWVYKENILGIILSAFFFVHPNRQQKNS